MKKMTFLKAGMACSALALIGLTASVANAQYVIGSFQGASDPNNAMWTDNSNSDPISSDPNAQFVALGVSDPNGPLSLEMTYSAYAFGDGGVTVSLNPAAITAFNNNNAIQFTFSVVNPNNAQNGYNQIYNLALNAPGYGYNNIVSGGGTPSWATYSTATGTTTFNQSGEPNYYWYNGAALIDTQTVTVNYGPELAAVIAGGESYVQFTFQPNSGSAAPMDIVYNDVALVTVPEPASIALCGLGLAAGVVLLRRRTA